jgi:hypothetical protein
VLCVVALSALAISVNDHPADVRAVRRSAHRLRSRSITAITTFLSSAGVPDDAVAIIAGSFTDFQAWIGGAVSSLVDRSPDAATVVILGGFLTFYVLYVLREGLVGPHPRPCSEPAGRRDRTWERRAG